VAVSGGMFCIVYGLSNAASHSWHTPSTYGFLAAGAALIVVFGFWQAKAPDPLLPPRVIMDRNRGGAYLAIGVVGAGMFGIFLFLTYYLQITLGYSPLVAGLAYLPMVACIAAGANIANIVLLPRLGPKPIIPASMLLAAGGAAWLTAIGPHSNYAAHVLGPIMLAGFGMGNIFSSAINTGTYGVAPRDAGVASASVNTGQQLGGSIGTALLNTVAASATSSYIVAHLSPATMVAGRPAPSLLQAGLIHGYSTAFWWSAGIFVGGAVVTGLLLRPGPLFPREAPAPAVQEPTAEQQAAGAIHPNVRDGL
jgi:hypothetical protein